MNVYSFHYDRAADALHNGEFQKAYEQLTPLIIESPDNADMLYDAGIAAYNMNKYDKARAYFLRATEHTDDVDLKIRSYFNAGNTSVALGELLKALEHYDAVLMLDDKNEYALYNKERVKEMLEQQKEREQQQDQKKQEEQQQQNNKEQQQNNNSQDNQQNQQDNDDSSQNDNNDQQDKNQQQQKNEDRQQNNKDKQQKNNSQKNQRNQQDNADSSQKDNGDQQDKQDSRNQKNQLDSQKDRRNSDDKNNEQGNRDHHSNKDSQQTDRNNNQQRDNHDNSPDKQHNNDDALSSNVPLDSEIEQDKDNLQGLNQKLQDPLLVKLLQEQEERDKATNKRLIEAKIRQNGGKNAQNSW